jgi:plasmid stabilization system protein ParE
MLDLRFGRITQLNIKGDIIAIDLDVLERLASDKILACIGVQRLYRFLPPKNLDAAMRAVKTIRQAVKMLEQQSGVGRPIEDMPDEFREWIIDFGDSGYVARYRIAPDAVTILAVRHQKEVGF